MKEYFYEKLGIYYKVNTFSKGKETLVFVHGLSGSSSAWLKYESYFESKYNVFVFDLRGHGKSKKYSRYNDYALDKFSDDLNELVQLVDAKNFILIGHSFGSLVCLNYVAHFGDKVKGLVLLSPNYRTGHLLLAKALQAVAPVGPAIDTISRVPERGGHVDYSRYPNSTDWSIPRMIADVHNTGLNTYLLCTRQSCGLDYQELLTTLEMPVLLMHGKEDSIFPLKNTVAMSSMIKNSKLVVLPGADHIIVLNNAEEIIREVEKFVEGLGE